MLLTADKGSGLQNGVAERLTTPSWYGTKCVHAQLLLEGADNGQKSLRSMEELTSNCSLLHI